MMKKQKQKNKGFTLAFAMLLSGVILSIGLGVHVIALQEFTLSSTGRESQFAFYAADSAAECALFWDIRHPGLDVSPFPTSTESTVLPSGSNLSCAGGDITNPVTGWDQTSGWNVTSATQNNATLIFDLLFDNGYCATVSVIKSSGVTRIDSRGYNTCASESRNRVERGIRVSY